MSPCTHLRRLLCVRLGLRLGLQMKLSTMGNSAEMSPCARACLRLLHAQKSGTMWRSSPSRSADGHVQLAWHADVDAYGYTETRMQTGRKRRRGCRRRRAHGDKAKTHVITVSTDFLPSKFQELYLFQSA